MNYGLPNEFSRCYISLNERDNKKTQRGLVHKLIDEDVNLTSLPSIAVSIAAKKENSAGKQWFFDFDLQDESLLAEFVADVERESSQYQNSEPVQILTQKTVNGYAVIVNLGFDTRNLLKKWSDVELKRDDYICCFWKHNKKSTNRALFVYSLYSSSSVIGSTSFLFTESVSDLSITSGSVSEGELLSSLILTRTIGIKSKK